MDLAPGAVIERNQNFLNRVSWSDNKGWGSRPLLDGDGNGFGGITS
jgi:hypothetical protein